MAQQISNTQLLARQQASARALKHAEAAVGQYAAAIRELNQAGSPVDWAPSVWALQQLALGVSRRLEGDVNALFERAIAKL